MADAWGGSWGSSWGAAWGATTEPHGVIVRRRKTKIWPTYKRGQPERQQEQIDETELALQQALAERDALIAELKSLNQQTTLSLRRMEAVQKLRDGRTQLNAQIKRLAAKQKQQQVILKELKKIRAKQEEEDMKVIDFVIKEFYH